ncbi:hypothetical protein [Bartonella sp. ML71XJBT]|nr:hypothetical protein [Bartonella sp. ML71XJBT]
MLEVKQGGAVMRWEKAYRLEAPIEEPHFHEWGDVLKGLWCLFV